MFNFYDAYPNINYTVNVNVNQGLIHTRTVWSFKTEPLIVVDKKVIV